MDKHTLDIEARAFLEQECARLRRMSFHSRISLAAFPLIGIAATGIAAKYAPFPFSWAWAAAAICAAAAFGLYWGWYCAGPWQRELRAHIASVLSRSDLLVRVLDGNVGDIAKYPRMLRPYVIPQTRESQGQSFKQQIRSLVGFYGYYARAYGLKPFPARQRFIDLGFIFGAGIGLVVQLFGMISPLILPNVQHSGPLGSYPLPDQSYRLLHPLGAIVVFTFVFFSLCSRSAEWQATMAAITGILLESQAEEAQ
jgi:hypothetical protein